MRILYSTIFILSLPLILLRLCWRGVKAPAYFKRWNERFALCQYKQDEKPIIWLHAVSVGEVEASRPLVDSLKAQYPQHQLLITTMTPTGSDRVLRLYGESVKHCYLPYDLPFTIRSFLKKTAPVMGIIMETELWPNLIYYSKHQHIPLLLINARMSAKSAEGYKKIQKTMQTMLQSFTFIAAQTKEDRERLIDLGAKPEAVHHTGNLKFEIEMPSSITEQAQSMRSMWGKRSVFIAASTHEGEDEIILNASRKIRAHYPDLLLILVPRHPERFDKVAALAQKSGYKILRRSDNGMCRSDVQVYIIDSMGELPLFYATADLAFVGGSLVETGGHNILEPAVLGRPIIIGPHYFNFKEISEHFIQANALQLIHDSETLSDAVVDLLNNPQRQAEMRDAGLTIIKQNQGASLRVLNLIKRHVHVRR